MFSLHLVSVKILDYVAGHKTRGFPKGHPKVIQLTGFLSNLRTPQSDTQTLRRSLSTRVTGPQRGPLVYSRLPSEPLAIQTGVGGESRVSCYCFWSTPKGLRERLKWSITKDVVYRRKIFPYGKFHQKRQDLSSRWHPYHFLTAQKNCSTSLQPFDSLSLGEVYIPKCFAAPGKLL